MAKKNLPLILQEHQVAKRALWLNYLKKYLHVLGREAQTPCVHVYDLFCGSTFPAATLDAVSQIDTIKLNFVFNDPDVAQIEIAQQTIFNIPNAQIAYHTQEYPVFIHYLQTQLDRFPNDKFVLWIDPYNYKPLNIIDLKHLLAFPNLDIGLFLPISRMYQFVRSRAEMPMSATLPIEPLEAFPSKPRAARDSSFEPLKQILYALFGRVMPVFHSMDDFAEKIAFQFNYQFQVFADTFQYQDDTNQIYYLYFFTANGAAFEKMLETKWELDIEQGTTFYIQRNMNLFSKMEQKDYDKKLMRFLVEQTRYNGEVYQFSLMHQILPAHTTQLLKKWQQQNILSAYVKPNVLARRGMFYLNHREPPLKIFFEHIGTEGT